ncbi:DUF3054 domain-containing protein [Leifsonia sp. Root112D2]|uniref:DUF3054 domain-containing protein n=1 Tax=Leifsonia sp. Root112D2 TaxID=1736426 RepID=UPI000700A265|nr:DUF3054 domain-containing protein [Leifsonia sp. Root112D2]KQV07376.1 hypothetical protein ASC63_08780 [Leifsonia sp. Root112D2]
MARTPVSPRRVVWALVLDVVLVLVFAIIGRASHTESLDVVGVLATFWPFLAGLAIGWLASQAWRRPFGIALPGISIWLITVIGGMLFRVISGQGTALAFVIVATVVLGILLVGWRAVAVAITRRRAGS